MVVSLAHVCVGWNLIQKCSLAASGDAGQIFQSMCSTARVAPRTCGRHSRCSTARVARSLGIEAGSIAHAFTGTDKERFSAKTFFKYSWSAWKPAQQPRHGPAMGTPAFRCLCGIYSFEKAVPQGSCEGWTPVPAKTGQHGCHRNKRLSPQLMTPKLHTRMSSMWCRVSCKLITQLQTAIPKRPVAHARKTRRRAYRNKAARQGHMMHVWPESYFCTGDHERAGGRRT